MPLELGIWRIDEKCRRVETTSLSDEARLEDLLDADISIVSPNWMIIGRQILTDFGNFIDLLAIDRDGSLIVLELKRDKTLFQFRTRRATQLGRCLHVWFCVGGRR